MKPRADHPLLEQIVSEESLRFAFDRVADFNRVHATHEDQVEAFETVFQAFGFTPDLAYSLNENLRKWDATLADSYFGMLVGLLMGLYYIEKESVS